MIFTTYSISNRLYRFPFDWNRQQILDFAMQGENGGIRVCPICHKIDVPLNHFDNGMCIPQEHSKLH